MSDDDVSIADNIIAGSKTFSERIGTSFYILGLYVTMLFYPHTMSYDYSFNHLQIVSIGNIFSIASMLFYIALGGYASYIFFNSLKKNPPSPLYKWEIQPILGFGILFFLITIFLFSNLVLTIGTSMGDRLMYFPSLGFCIVMTVLIAKVSLSITGDLENINTFLPLGKAGMGLLFSILLLYSFKTYSRNADWKDNYTLYSHDIKLVPNSVKAHYYLGLELIKTVAELEQNLEKKKALYEEGIRELERSVEIMPSFGSAFTQMGVAYFRLKNFEKAIENYNKAAALKQADAITLNNIGSVYFEWKKYEEAAENFKKALQIDPRFIDAYMNLGSVYGTLGNFNSAIECFQNAIKYSPDNARAYYYIAMTYQNMGDKSNADKYYGIAGQMNPQFTKPH
jgi:Tfp pilus assembly protein PilF